MKKLIVAILVAAIMGGGLCDAQAGTLTLSTMSSEEDEFGGTLPDVLDANITFHVAGTSLTIDVNNLTGGDDAYVIPQIYFNAVPRLSPFNSLPTGWNLTSTESADGFGTFDYLIGTDNQNGIPSGASLDFALTIGGIGGPWSQSDFDEEWSDIPPGSRPAIVVMKFVNGPDDDSAFGAVPEPSTVVLLGLGSLLLLHRRRSRGG